VEKCSDREQAAKKASKWKPTFVTTLAWNEKQALSGMSRKSRMLRLCRRDEGEAGIPWDVFVLSPPKCATTSLARCFPNHRERVLHGHFDTCLRHVPAVRAFHHELGFTEEIVHHPDRVTWAELVDWRKTGQQDVFPLWVVSYRPTVDRNLSLLGQMAKDHPRHETVVELLSDVKDNAHAAQSFLRKRGPELTDVAHRALRNGMQAFGVDSLKKDLGPFYDKERGVGAGRLEKGGAFLATTAGAVARDRGRDVCAALATKLGVTANPAIERHNRTAPSRAPWMRLLRSALSRDIVAEWTAQDEWPLSFFYGRGEGSAGEEKDDPRVPVK
jgi:hypothetical protein